MMQIVDIQESFPIEAYEQYPALSMALLRFREEVSVLAPRLEGRKIWMVNSTATGGGVAEMMPRMIGLMREVDIEVEWAVMNTDREPFFALTKNLHNLIHGAGHTDIGQEEREMYEAVNRENAEDFLQYLSPEDMVVIHDPQPMAMGPILKEKLGLKTVWRCHIGLDETNEQTRAAWDFLDPYVAGYDRFIFSVPSYVPDRLTKKTVIIEPAIDPLTHKNRHLPLHKLSGILIDGGILENSHQAIAPPFEHQVKRVMPDGSFGTAHAQGDLGLLFRPVITQISRWDKLKGWLPLLQGFVKLKQEARFRGHSDRHDRRLEILRLVLAGPDPAFVADDPEGKATLEELIAAYQDLPAEVQTDVALLLLPMNSRKENALIVNALQRCSTVVAQNSLQEGFGLTVSEAMWKGIPVMGSQAAGIRQQLRDNIEGRLTPDAKDPDAVAQTLHEMLIDADARSRWGFSAQRRAIDHFLVFAQINKYLEMFCSL